MELQPPDVEEDRDAMLENWIESKVQNGFVVLTREELDDRLDRYASDAYAQGRADQLAEASIPRNHLCGNLAECTTAPRLCDACAKAAC